MENRRRSHRVFRREITKVSQRSYWLDEILPADLVDRARDQSGGKDFSVEALIGRQLDGVAFRSLFFGDKSFDVARATVLSSVLSLIGFFNLPEEERLVLEDTERKRIEAGGLDFSSGEVVIDSQVVQDVQWVCGRFGIKIPRGINARFLSNGYKLGEV